MASSALIGCGITALILSVLQIVGLATTHWFVLTQSGEPIATVGLFQICVKSTPTCVSYSKYMFEENHASVSYIAFVGMQVVGGVLLLVSIIVVGCASLFVHPAGYDHQTVRRVLGLWATAGVLIVVGTIWFSVDISYADDILADSLSQLEFRTGYSLIITAMVGASSIVGAFALGIVSSRMSPPQAPAAMVIPSGPQVIVMQNGTTVYPPTAPSGYSMPNPTVHTPGLPQMDPAYGYNQA